MLLCNAGRVLLGCPSAITKFLTTSTSLKRVILMISLSFGKKSKWNGTKPDEYGAYACMVMFLSARNNQIFQFTQSLYFSDAQIISVIMFLTLSFYISCWLQSFEQSTDHRHMPTILPAWRWPQSCLLKASCSWSHLSLLQTLFEPHFPIKKYVSARCCYLHTLAE